MKISKQKEESRKFRKHSKIFVIIAKIAQLNFCYIAKFRYVAKMRTDDPPASKQNFE